MKALHTEKALYIFTVYLHSGPYPAPIKVDESFVNSLQWEQEQGHFNKDELALCGYTGTLWV